MRVGLLCSSSPESINQFRKGRLITAWSVLKWKKLTRSFQNAIKLCHPRRQNRLLAQPINLRQRSHPLLNVIAKYLTKVMLRASSTCHHLLNAIRLEEHIVVGLNSILKRFVSHYLRLALHKSLKAIRYRVEILFRYFLLTFCHIVWLFAVEWIRYAARNENVELNAPLAFLFLDFVPLSEFGGIFRLFACKRR
jgi:hypothetical protein